MTRQFTCGFEQQSVAVGLSEWDNLAAGGGTAAISTTVKNSGLASLEISSLSSGQAKGLRRHVFAAAATTPSTFYRRYLRVDTLPSAANRIMLWNDTDNLTLPMVWINLVNDGTLTLNDEDGQIGSASAALSLSTQHRIEIKIDITGAAGAHVVEAKIDGTVFATASDRNISAGIFTETIGGNLASEAQTTGVWYFDDCATNLGDASPEDGYPGAWNVLYLRPNAAGDNEQWLLGTTGSVSAVSEFPPDDATTFIASNTSGEISDFNIDNTPVEMDSGATINLVQVCVRASLSDATGGDPNAVLRAKASPGGTVEESANLGGNTTTWNTNGFSAPRGAKLTLYNMPGASADPITKADLDTFQIGVRETNNDTHLYRVSALWLVVEWKPGSAVATRKFQRSSVLGV